MNPLLSTLPGDIPGLLRRGSPVMYGTRARVVEDVGDFRLGGLHLAQEQFATCRLDFSDPTGRVHAAWWIRSKSTEGSAIWASIGREDWHLTDLAERNAPMTPEQIDTLARLVLRLAGRTP